MIEEIFNDCNSVEHGGNIYRLAEELKIQERKVIDFSSSVNPLGVSKKVKAEVRKHLKYLHNYPDPEAKRLRKRLAQYHGIDLETILCGNGSIELIYLIARALKPQKVLIPAPTFSEYERACTTSCKSQVASYELKKEDDFNINPEEFVEAMKGCDMAFLCNPNNPTGRLLKKEGVRKIADTAKELKCYLIVDEAFIDFCPEETVINEVQNNSYLIVLRSMTPFYALPGLRIGYGIFPMHLIRTLKEHKEPWTVNSLAQRAAVVALKDKVYRNETLRLIKAVKQFFEKNFKKVGIEYFHSDTNFYLIRIENANEISRQLGRKGMLVRECKEFRGLDNTYLRIAVKSHRENTILIKELTAFLDKRNNEENKNR
ncbi:MAG: threonine-phosphate decarboxylase [Nitrospirae bacterium RBG_13_41_22]|nr:MAG: threonine-phosphate decarboxylase [Nitrospirae bacterium RBG_13_41_22]OHE58055.1 MAG: threonine-phosphate decarboxylase [Thermodesulfovibrio sp. RBG_19FT_COMBO_42_12]